MDRKSNFRRGSVELMVLHLLSLRDYYGYELTQIIRQETNGVIDIPIGSLYPALYKLIDAGYISDHKEQVGKRMIRIYYHLEDSGKTRLDLLLHNYYQTNQAIQDILRFNGDEQTDEHKEKKGKLTGICAKCAICCLPCTKRSGDLSPIYARI